MKKFYLNFLLTSSFIFTFFGAFAQLSGTYTIDQSGSGDFISLQSASEAVNSQGMSGPVTLQLKSGVYNQPGYFEVLNHHSNHVLTIESMTGNEADVVLRFEEGNSEENFQLGFRNMQGVTIKNITINTANLEYGTGIVFFGQCSNIEIQNLDHIGNRNDPAIVASFDMPLQPTHNFTVTESHFFECSPSIAIGAMWMIMEERSSNISIHDNTFFDADGVDVHNIDGIKFKKNLAYGQQYNVQPIKMTYCSGIEISGNTMYNTFKTVSIMLCEGTAEQPLIVSNNFISGKNEILALVSNQHLLFAHNSVYGNHTDHLLSHMQNEDSRFYNNIFYQNHLNGGIFFAYNLESQTALFDYNCLYSNGFYATDGTSQLLNYAEYKDLTQRETNGVSVQPDFAIPGEDLHVNNQALNQGIPLSEVTTDIDGELRSSVHPTIGADEMDGMMVSNDLTIDTVITSGSLNGGEPLTITWSGQNLSNSSFNPPWTDRIYLSDDAVLDPSDQVIHNYQVSAALPAFETYNRQIILDMDLALEGTKYIIVKIDANANLLEDNANNVAVSAPFTVTPPDLPNLVVTDITLPDNIFSGTSLQVNFIVKNIGQAPAEGEWTDFIWMEDAIGNFSQGVDWYKLLNNPQAKVNNVIGLMPGDSYQGTATFTVPYVAQGYRYIRVETDAYDNIAEEIDANDNFTNALIDSVFVNQTPLADLTITDIQTPAQGFSGEEIDVIYSVKNIGTKTTSPVPKASNYYMGWTWGALSGDWLDYIYLSDGDFAFHPNDYNRVYTHEGLLPVDSSYLATTIVKLPKCTSGEYFITVATDRWNHVAELVENNNEIVSDPIQVLARPAPDLVPASATTPDAMTSNASYTVSYTVENLGADTAFAKWRDRVFLSHSSTFGSNINEMAGDTLRNITLAPDESATLEMTFDIPPHMYGEVYLYLWIDATNKVCEYPYDNNNILKLPLSVAMSPAADLEVSFNEPQGTVTAGDALNLQATVKNEGDDIPNNFVWTDRIFLKSEVSSASDTTYFEDYLHQNILPVNSSYNLPDPFTIPLQTPPGFYHLGVITDLYENVWENELEENNIAESDVFQVVIDSSRTPDLKPLSLIAQNWTSGQSHQVQVKSRNHAKSINLATWIDELLLTDTLGQVIAKATSAYSGSLNSGSEYTATFQLNIPPGTPQNAIFTMRIDTSNAVFEYNKLNNIAHFPIEVETGPAPDLAPTNLDVPTFVNAGQEITLSVLRNNFGEAAINQKSWTEKVLLSKNDTPDNKDIVLRSYSYLNEDMPAQYAEMLTDEIQIPLYYVGTYYLIYYMDSDNNILEGEFEDNNYIVSEQPIEITVPLPVDFLSEFNDIQMVDDNPQWLQYKLTNTGSNTFDGKFYNTYFLSTDAEYSTDDLFIGIDRVADYDNYNENQVLEPGESILRNAHFLYNPVVAGEYYVIQKVDAMLNVYETDETNNTFAFGPFYIDNIPELVADSSYSKRFGYNPPPVFYGFAVSGLRAITDLSGWHKLDKLNGDILPKAGYYGYDPGFDPFPSRHDFKIQVPDGFGMVAHMWEDEDLNQMSGVSAIDKPIYEMYIGEEFVPTPLHYDFRFDQPMQNEQTIIVPVAGDRMDYIKTRATYLPPMALPNEVLRNNYLLRAEFREFSVYKIHPEKVGTSHNVTLRITGFDLEDPDGLEVALIHGSDTTWAFESYPQNASELVAYIDMRKKTPGNYELMVRKIATGNYTIWDEAVEVIADDGASIIIDVSGPSASRTENDVQVEVAYGNTGYSNEYDMLVIVAVFMDDSTSNGLNVNYLGSTYSGFDGTGFISTEHNEAELIELGVFDDAVYYGAYVPIVHAQSRESFHFKINGTQPGQITIQGSLGLLQRSPYTFTGRVTDAGSSHYLVMLDNAMAKSDDILAALGKSGGDGCDAVLDVNNMTERLAHQTYAVAERARGASSFKDDVKKNVKTVVDHEAGIKAKYDAMKDMISQKNKLSLTANDETPFYSELKDVFKCLGPEAEIKPVPGEKCRQKATWSRGGVEYEVKLDMRDLNSSHCPLPADDKQIVKSNIVIDYPTSKDPNEIVGPAGSGPARIVSTDELFEYTVFFENMAEAGAPAAQVRIDNPLDSNLRIASFRIKSFGFADTTFNFNHLPFIQQSLELGSEYHGDMLRIVAGADIERNRAFFEFTTVDSDTRAPVTGANNGFLLPNDSTGRGQGFVTYVIEPKSDLDPGTRIQNKAAIVFDGNEIIETNTWSNIISGGDLKSKVLELPLYSAQHFDVEWINLTPSFGPPAESYNIYVRDINETDEWTKWIDNAQFFKKTFTGTPGHTYEFYSQAYSGGIREKVEIVPHATTTVLDFKGDMSDGKPIIFPNPAMNTTTLAYQSPGAGESMRIDITDPSGKRVSSQKFAAAGKGIQYHEIPLHQLAPGVYIVTLYHDKDRVGSARLVTLGVNKE